AVISRRDHLRRCLRSYAGGEPGAGSTDGVGGLSRSGFTVPAGSVCTRALNSTQHSPLGIQNVNGSVLVSTRPCASPSILRTRRSDISHIFISVRAISVGLSPF